MKFRKMSCLIVITTFIVSPLFSSLSAWPWSKGKREKDNYPLYVSEDGWQIYSAVPTEKIISIYLRAKEMAESFGAADASIEYWEYVIKQGMENYYNFVLVVPENEVIFWSKKSQIIMTYTTKQDTIEVASSEFFFANACTNCKPAMIISSEITGYYSVPNRLVYRTPHGYPVVIARFDFKNKWPKRILKCSVRNVICSIK